MKNLVLKKSTLLITFFVLFNALTFGQKVQSVDERNVRAEMNFLAGDAMQGRGSGTLFERVAAEYIGSQFMQFGLEPAGEKDAQGNQTYVQTVEVGGRNTLKELKILGDLGNSIVFGRDFGILSISEKEISGGLQKISGDEKATTNSIVLLKTNPDQKIEAIFGQAQQFAAAGAKAVFIVETAEIREHWDDLTKRPASLSKSGGNVFAISKDASEKMAALPNGTPINLSAQFTEPQKSYTWNAMGKIAGSDPKLASEIILLTSHLDHLGVRQNAPTEDKIFNGADDDASGSIAVLELARVLARGAKPKRTVYFVCFGSEEAGGYGARYFVNNLPFPKEKLVANLEFEMIGRPDAKVQPDQLWLTGYERSNLGAELAKRGAKLVGDPHPEQNFFRRSDNYTLAKQGIIAHTVSSYGLHTDYHHASDEIKTIDFVHMTRSINSMILPIKWLVNSPFTPTWNKDGKP